MANVWNAFSFQISTFEMNLEALDTIHLPAYQGSTLRGAFGHSFRKVACAVRSRECDACLLKEKCVYAYVFETPRPEDAEMMRLYPKVPHPFVLEPPLNGRQEIGAGETLPMGLAAVGRGIEFLPYFVYAVQQMGEQGLGKGRGRFVLKTVSQVQWPDGDQKRLYEKDEERLERPDSPVTWEDILCWSDKTGPIEGISLMLLTPLRIKSDGRFVRDLEFHHLIRNLLRRLSALSYFHCGGDGQLDFKGLIKKAMNVRTVEKDLQWRDWERYSTRQQERMKMGGLVGSITFEGPLNDFLPFLILGELVHIGKGTSFGLGKYRMGFNC